MMQNNTDWWKAFEAKRAECKKLKEQLRLVREERNAYKDRYEIQSNNLSNAMDSIARQDKAIENALDLAMDVDWFVRMQGSEDVGMQHTIQKAKAFIKEYGGEE